MEELKNKLEGKFNKLEGKFNEALDNFLSILKNNYKNIYGIFVYGSFARGDFDKNSDIDLFLILDLNENHHEFLTNNINGIPITTEVIDKKSFKKNIFDNRIAQAKIVFDRYDKLKKYKEDIKKNFFSDNNINLRIDKRKITLSELIKNYDSFNNIEKVLSVFTFIKIYSLIVMDKNRKIPSKKIEFQEVLGYLGANYGTQWENLIKLGFKQEILIEKITKISSIIFFISNKILKTLEGKNTPFTSRVNKEYYNDFLESTKQNNSLLPIITWIEIIISKFSIFHTTNSSLNFSDFTINLNTILKLKENGDIQNEYDKLEKIIKKIDKKVLLELKNNMEFLFNKI